MPKFTNKIDKEGKENKKIHKEEEEIFPYLRKKLGATHRGAWTRDTMQGEDEQRVEFVEKRKLRRKRKGKMN